MELTRGKLLHLQAQGIAEPGRALHGETNAPVRTIPVLGDLDVGKLQCLPAPRGQDPLLR